MGSVIEQLLASNPALLAGLIGASVTVNTAAFYLGKVFTMKHDQKFVNAEVSLPPEIKKVTPDTNSKNLNAEEYKDNLIQFVGALNHIDLTRFYNNLQSLSIKREKTFFFHQKSLHKASGFYSHDDNRISLLEKYKLIPLDHELLHMASSYPDSKRAYVGFQQYDLKKCVSIGSGLNEGYTSLLEDRYFSHIGSSGRSYPTESYFAERLELIMGQSDMEQMYFRADLYSLIETLKKYDTEANIMAFIRHLDFFNKYGSKIKLIGKHYLSESYRELSLMLMRWGLEKIKVRYQEGAISETKMMNQFARYVSTFDPTFRFRGKKYTCFTEDDIRDIYYKSMDNIEKVEMVG